MNTREKMQKLADKSNVNSEFVMEMYDIICEVAGCHKTPRLRPYQQKAIDDLRESFREPQLIQGYTAEQWQEIVDGGYLCEVRDFDTEPWMPAILMNIKDVAHDRFVVVNANAPDGEEVFYLCRPAQIKGVMKPIFVEPENPAETPCTFFSKDSLPVSPDGLDMSGSAYVYSMWIADALQNGATKYIEV